MAKFVVDVYEYERGWGNRLDETREFPLTDDGYKDAKTFQESINCKNIEKTIPDVYWIAFDPRVTP